MDFIEIVPGKTNLKEYKHGNWKVHQFQDDEMAPGWESMDDTSSWILNTDEQTVVGQVDWTVGSPMQGEYLREYIKYIFADRYNEKINQENNNLFCSNRIT